MDFRKKISVADIKTGIDCLREVGNLIHLLTQFYRCQPGCVSEESQFCW